MLIVLFNGVGGSSEIQHDEISKMRNYNIWSLDSESSSIRLKSARQTDRKTRDPIFNRIDTVFLAILMRMTKFQKKKMYRSSSRRDSWQQSTDRGKEELTHEFHRQNLGEILLEFVTRLTDRFYLVTCLLVVKNCNLFTLRDKA
ncbi:hypothetical protein T4B_5014 [Trichinella pseudospiralis]|uniref:Uncharacterized protein n=1 Tax=Trichinella pseudospiralis TaxID=6337 RepID=A0A0V1IZP1_TRIPS|nr:hypothetical protein T4B_5014 [Trichinella pseudospiralis]